MRQLNTSEVQQVSGAAVVVDVNTPAQYVKVSLTALWGLVKIPLANVDWSKWGK
jgi:hypothetical protein